MENNQEVQWGFNVYKSTMSHVTAQFSRTIARTIPVTGISNELYSASRHCRCLGAGNIPQTQQHHLPRRGMMSTGSQHAYLDNISRQNLPVTDQSCTCFAGSVVASPISGVKQGNSLTGTCLCKCCFQLGCLHKCFLPLHFKNPIFRPTEQQKVK